MPQHNSPDKPPATGSRERRFLETESVRWKDLGLIDAPTRAALLALYPEPPHIASRLEGVAKAVGASLLGMALLLFNAHNWDNFAPWTRFAVLALTLAGCHVATLFCLRTGLETLGKALAILASAAFGAGIMLVGQAFNLESGTAAPFVVWTLGVLPFAIMTGALPLYLFAGALSLVPLFWNSGYDSTFRHEGFEPEKTLPLLVAAFSMATGYLRGRRALVAVAIPLAAATLIEAAGLFSAHEELGMRAGVVIAGLCLTLAMTHRENDPIRLSWRNWAGWAAIIFLTYAGSSIMNDDYHRQQNVHGVSVAWIPPAVFFAAVAVWVFWKSGSRKPNAGIVTGILTMLAALWLPIGTEYAIVAFNLAQIAFGVLLLRDGAKLGRVGGYSLGVFVIAVWAVARYVDIGKDFGMLGVAAMLATTGIGFFVAARIWKNVREERLEFDATPATSTPAVAEWIAAFSLRRIPLLAGVATASLGVLAFMAIDASMPLWTGKEIRMEVTPVDPNDLFRGDYVTLDFKARHPDKIERTPDDITERTDVIPIGATVYVILDDDGTGIMRPVRWTLEKPAGGLFLRGAKTSRWNGEIHLGIERFYVREGTGSGWEKARNDRRLTATLRVASDGTTRVTGLAEVSKAP